MKNVIQNGYRKTRLFVLLELKTRLATQPIQQMVATVLIS